MNEPAKCAELLQSLVKKDEYQTLLAYQIAFDLEATTSQEFLKNVKAALPAPVSVAQPQTTEAVPAATPETTATDAMETDETTPLVKKEAPATAAAASSTAASITETDPMTQIHKILSGESSIQLHLEFLHRNNHTDLLILKKTREALEKKTMVFHSAITVANAYMNAGTTSDEFLRQNLEWLAKASNWTKFGATAALGVIHKVNYF